MKLCKLEYYGSLINLGGNEKSCDNTFAMSHYDFKLRCDTRFQRTFVLRVVAFSK
jgi:hypothetical protein